MLSLTAILALGTHPERPARIGLTLVKHDREKAMRLAHLLCAMQGDEPSALPGAAIRWQVVERDFLALPVELFDAAIANPPWDGAEQPRSSSRSNADGERGARARTDRTHTGLNRYIPTEVRPGNDRPLLDEARPRPRSRALRSRRPRLPRPRARVLARRGLARQADGQARSRSATLRRQRKRRGRVCRCMQEGDDDGLVCR